ncbi:MAG: hypothetical protein ABIZ81_15180 [Opitutaceae bacterium]
MKLRTIICGTLLTVASAAAQPVTVPALGPRFKQTRERAEVMLGRRNGSYPAPDVNLSLFQTPVTATVTSANTEPEPEPVGSDETLLAEAFATLTKGKGGILVTPDGRAHLTVGPKTYRQGENLPVVLRTGTIDLRIARITGNSVTLTLNESEVVWRF